MEQVLRRLREAAADPPVNGQQGMGQFRRVLRTDLVQILESFYENDRILREKHEQIEDLFKRINDLNKELGELQASVFIPLKSL